LVGEQPKKEKVNRMERKQQKHAERIQGFRLSEVSQIRNGMVMDRHITDAFCLLLFFAVFIAMIVMGIYGASKGDLQRVMGGVDGDLRICGSDVGVENYPKLYIVDLS